MPLRLNITSENVDLPDDRQAKVFNACGGTIGRNEDNDWSLPDPHCYVSGRHALIDFQAGAYYLIDTSRNGVYINGADAPVGRGHPQRLFDGDKLRIGEFDIVVTVTPDDPELFDDGLRDSVIRAQLVPEDESVELSLVDEQKLDEDQALVRHLDGSSQLSERMALADMVNPQSSKEIAENKAVGVLLEAAGIKASDLNGVPPAQVLETAGQLLRAFVEGLSVLIQERTKLKENFRLPNTLIQGKQNNPLKFSPTTEDALSYLLGNATESYLKPLEAVQHTFTEIRHHERAVPKAMLYALKDFLERFDPDELRAQFDLGLKRSRLLSGTNKLKYWELYQEIFHVLTHAEDGRPPEAFTSEFARAYALEVESQKASQS